MSQGSELWQPCRSGLCYLYRDAVPHGSVTHNQSMINIKFNNAKLHACSEFLKY